MRRNPAFAYGARRAANVAPPAPAPVPASPRTGPPASPGAAPTLSRFCEHCGRPMELRDGLLRCVYAPCVEHQARGGAA